MFALCLLVALSVARSGSANEVVSKQHASPPVPIWNGQTPQDLHREYSNIFRYGNRNAASHLWSTFLLERSAQMTRERLERLFAGYCAVSGSPVRPHDFNRYRLDLHLAADKSRIRRGYMHYCCWPCVCDTQDFIRVDTKTVETSEGRTQYHFAVLGNPCEKPEELVRPFVQPFGRGSTTLRQSAPEVRCGENNELLGATLSDHGFIIIAMFFDSPQPTEEDKAVVLGDFAPTPGRTQKGTDDVQYQDEAEWSAMCTDRANKGYNSGMGEIFRKVAMINPISKMPGPFVNHTHALLEGTESISFPALDTPEMQSVEQDSEGCSDDERKAGTCPAANTESDVFTDATPRHQPVN